MFQQKSFVTTEFANKFSTSWIYFIFQKMLKKHIFLKINIDDFNFEHVIACWDVDDNPFEQFSL